MIKTRNLNTWGEKLAFYDKLVSTIPNVERKGNKMPYTAANGHMFSQLNKEGELGIRLSRTDKQLFLAKHKTPAFISYGVAMKEYVLIPESLFDNMELLSSYLKKSYEYALSMEPK